MTEPEQIQISPQGMVNALTAQRNELANQNAMLLARLTDMEAANAELTERLNGLEKPIKDDLNQGGGASA
jgi:hypothetical protein